MAQQNNTSTSIKNVQNNNRQNSFLVKNYLEQRLETQGDKTRVIYDAQSKSLIQFRTNDSIIAVIRDGKLHVFEIPMKKFNGSMPLEFESVQIDSIQTQKATCCKKCHSWKLQANITRCECGGYLVPRKRFAVGTVESWDEEFLEIEFARKDIRAAKKIERILSKRQKQYTPTGITAKLAGTSSIIPEEKSHMELLLIPESKYVKKAPVKSGVCSVIQSKLVKVWFIKQVQVRSVESCSMVFVADINSHGLPCKVSEIIKRYDLNPTEGEQVDSSFASDVTSYNKGMAPENAQTMLNSWNESSVTPKRYQNTSKREIKQLRNTNKQPKLYNKTGKHQQRFSSSMPVPKEHQK